MKATFHLLATAALAAALILVRGGEGPAGGAQSDEAAACNLLKRLSQSSNNWAEVVAYKNSFDFAKARVRQPGSVAESEQYFRELTERYQGQKIVFCMSLNREPSRNCGFVNIETQDSLLELIQRKMERDKLTADDIYHAIDNARPRKKETEYKPLRQP